MTAELVRGQNHPLPAARLDVRVSAPAPVVAGATLADAEGRLPGIEWVAHPGAPALPGLEVSRQAAAEHRLAFDLDALPESVHRVGVLLALPTGTGGPARFGGLAAPVATVTGPDGTAVARYTISGLDTESALIALEFYRRQGAWKVRAVGQGYAGGLAALLADQNLPGAERLAAEINETALPGPARPFTAPPPPPRLPEEDHTRRMATPPAAQEAQGSPPSYEDPRLADGLSAPRQAPGTLPPSGDPPGEPRPGPRQEEAAGPTGSVSRPASGGPVGHVHPGRRSAAPPAHAPTAPPDASGPPTGPFAGDATGWSPEERLHNQVWGMFEDLARSAAAYRGAVDFADSRLDRELDQVLADPRLRLGGQGDAAREAARARHTLLVTRAREAFDRDLAQLVAESEVVEPALPTAFARWDNPVWHEYRVPTRSPMAVRLGDLRLPESGELRIPLLVPLPLERGLWIDSGHSGSPDPRADPEGLRRLAMETAVAHAGRLLAVHPPDAFAVEVIDPAGSAAGPLAPLVRSGLLAAPPAVGADGVTATLTRLTRRIDLLQMAARGGAPDALPPDLDTAGRLLIVHDFPYGFDDRAVTRLRHLADEGPSVGVQLMLVADREDAAGFGSLLDPLWRSLLRLTPVPDDHLADPWVGHAWTYEPPRVPRGGGLFAQVLGRIAEARGPRSH
ncbi:TerD family protein [Streptomyces sp. NPDC052040]|uniref:TerD family protein n=1 Tax=Streptomyces sp. NPDC052040 TaxID=3365682 RepID=UPI0037CFBBA2